MRRGLRIGKLTRPDCFPEDFRVLPVVIPELELYNIEGKVFPADFVERPDHAALNQGPETFNRVRVDRADDIFPFAVIDDGGAIIRALTFSAVEI
jgi:hypothetical protein